MLKLRDARNEHKGVWLAEPGVKVGRLANNDLVVNHPSIVECQFEIRVKGEHLLLRNRVPRTSLTVNKQPVVDGCVLRENDLIALDDLQWQLVDPKKAISSRPSALWSLKGKGFALADRVYPLHDTTIVGRSRECDISLAITHLSRRHACLQVRDGLLYVKDLGSANGTYLNGKRVFEARVRRGDELCLDTLSFGVLGPADDLGKTSIRALPRATSPSVGNGRSPPRGRPVTVRRTARAAVVDELADASQPSRRFNEDSLVWLGLLLLVFLGAGLVYPYF